MALTSAMACRPGCGACCIAPSISSPIPGMPAQGGIGKPAGRACLHLDPVDMRCGIFGQPQRPQVCGSLVPSPEMCGENREQAMLWLGHLERQTAP